MTVGGAEIRRGTAVPGRDRWGHGLLLAAATAGSVHAMFSLVWAAGSPWLLDTVGSWAVRLQDTSPVLAGLGMLAIGLIKLAAAWLPWLARRWRTGVQRIVRAASWLGGIGLTLYGGANVAVGVTVLTGISTPEGGFDRAAMLGHALLWDPLFLIWGLTLVLALCLPRLTRPRRGA